MVINRRLQNVDISDIGLRIRAVLPDNQSPTLFQPLQISKSDYVYSTFNRIFGSVYKLCRIVLPISNTLLAAHRSLFSVTVFL